MRQAVFALSIIMFVAVTAAALQHGPSDAIAATNDGTTMPSSLSQTSRSSC